MDERELTAYCQRIGLTKSDVQHDLATLEAITKLHLKTIPYENLDIFMNKEILLDKNSLLSKLLTHHRGGWCHEVNGALHLLLQSLGFDSFLCGSKVWYKTHFGEMMDHMVVIVKINDEHYLMDVGWGGHARQPSAPLLIKEGFISKQLGTTYRMDRDGEFWVPRYLDDGDEWSQFMGFSFSPVSFQDFERHGKSLQIPGFILADRLTMKLMDKDDESIWHTVMYSEYRKVRCVDGENKQIVQRQTIENQDDLKMILKKYFRIESELPDFDENRWKAGRGIKTSSR